MIASMSRVSLGSGGIGSDESTVALAQLGPTPTDDAELAGFVEIFTKVGTKPKEVHELVNPLIRR